MNEYAPSGNRYVDGGGWPSGQSPLLAYSGMLFGTDEGIEARLRLFD